MYKDTWLLRLDRGWSYCTRFAKILLPIIVGSNRQVEWIMIPNSTASCKRILGTTWYKLSTTTRSWFWRWRRQHEWKRIFMWRYYWHFTFSIIAQNLTSSRWCQWGLLEHASITSHSRVHWLSTPSTNCRFFCIYIIANHLFKLWCIKI